MSPDLILAEAWPVVLVEGYGRGFLDFARLFPNLTFRLTPIGCGLAGYKPDQIGPMFKGAPANVIIPPEFEPFAGVAA